MDTLTWLAKEFAKHPTAGGSPRDPEALKAALREQRFLKLADMNVRKSNGAKLGANNLLVAPLEWHQCEATSLEEGAPSRHGVARNAIGLCSSASCSVVCAELRLCEFGPAAEVVEGWIKFDRSGEASIPFVSAGKLMQFKQGELEYVSEEPFPIEVVAKVRRAVLGMVIAAGTELAPAAPGGGPRYFF